MATPAAAGDALPRMRALRSRNRVLAREAAGGLAALDGHAGGGGGDASAKAAEAARLREAFEAAARDFRAAVTASVGAEAAAAAAAPAAAAAWAAAGAAAPGAGGGALPGAAGGGGGGRGLDGLPTAGSRRGDGDELAPLLSGAGGGGPAASYGAPAPLAPTAQALVDGRRVDAAVREVRSTASLLASRDAELAAVAAASAETAAIMRDLAGMIGEQGDTVVEVAADLDTAAVDVGRARAQLAKTAARKDLRRRIFWMALLVVVVIIVVAIRVLLG